MGGGKEKLSFCIKNIIGNLGQPLIQGLQYCTQLP